ncbi:transmembrane channel-like protein 6 isoform X2 [Polyodon spathula]|uniref:transmembrane channel-like protein 6 isoform X2 n=1 Tax=Polyodon spathula TaxID=7913 RepID=UPI001B7DE69D|nr:transmembrane channel-like protein 6 isoform X2 [Polyodon spathula]
MARSISFHLDLSEAEEGQQSLDFSPYDENIVHDSFNELIEEQSQSQDGFEVFEMEDMADRGRENPAFLASPLHGRSNREQRREEEPLLSENFSPVTLRVLSAMPSRTIGRNRGAIISQYYNRTMKLRRRRSRPSIRDLSRSARPSICGYRVETDPEAAAEEENRQHLIDNLQNLSVSDRGRMLKTMPLSLLEKKSLRHACNSKGFPRSRNQIPCCSQLKYYLIIGFRHGWYSLLSFLHSLQLWHVALKKLSGRFGTGVLSYFVFLKTLLLFNVFLLLVNVLFLAVPQAAHPPSEQTHRPPFQGLEVLTGAGYFTDTVLYYGYYTNSTVNGCGPDRNGSGCTVGQNSLDNNTRMPYNIPLAYFFIIGVSFFITCIILVYSMSKSFGQSYRIDNPHGDLAMKMFCSWDFKVIKKSSVKLQCENICTQMKELLSELARASGQQTLLQRLARMMVHLLAWVMSLGSTVACAMGIYYFSTYMHKDLTTRVSRNETLIHVEASLLALPVVVSTVNLLMPGLFNAAAWMEQYDAPSTQAYVAICRNLLLKMSVLGVLCYHWLGTTISGHVTLSKRVRQNGSTGGLECWETFVGQELYRFLLMDFIFTILDTIFGEFVWRLFSQKVLKRKRKPVFDIARNVLELIYGQTLTWLGVLFSPLLPAIQVIKLVLLFYIKRTSLMMNCQAPSKPWRASQMTTIFITLLCFPAFLGAAVAVTYTIWTIKPSEGCGPFRTLDTMFESGKIWVRQLEEINSNFSWFTWIHKYLVENPFFLFAAAGVLLIVIYFHAQVVGGQRKIISLLQEQIDNEGEDKKFLITRLQDIYEKKRPISVRFKQKERRDDSRKLSS